MAEEDAVVVEDVEEEEEEEAEVASTILKSPTTIELNTKEEREDIRDPTLTLVLLISNLELARKTTVAKPDTRREVMTTSQKELSTITSMDRIKTLMNMKNLTTKKLKKKSIT